MKEIYLKYKLLIFPLAVGLASFVLIIFLIVPQLKNFLKGQQNLGSTKTRLEILQVKAEELEDLDQNSLTKSLAAATYSLPTDKDFANLIGILRQLTAQAGMSLTSLQINEASGNEENSFSVRMEAIGAKSALGFFLSSLEKAPRIMKISTIEITSPATSDLVSVTVSVAVYYSPPPQSLGEVDAVLPKLSEKDTATLSNLPSVSIPVEVTQPTILPSGKSNPFE